MEAGDAFNDQGQNVATPEVVLARARLIVDAFNELEVDAYAPGERDLAFGFESFKALATRAKFSVLSANLSLGDGTKPFSPSILKEVGKLKVGIIGLTGQRIVSSPEVLAANGVIIGDPTAAAQAEAVTLAHQGADLILVLGHLDPGEEDAVALGVPQVRFIIGGHAARMLHQPRPIAADTTSPPRAWALDAGSKGKYLGKLAVYLPLEAGAPLTFADLNTRMELRGQTLALEKDIERTRDNITKAKTESAGSAEQREKRIKGLEAAIERNEKTLKERRAALAAIRPPTDTEGLLRNELLPVDMKLAADPEIDKAVTAFLDATKTATPKPAEAVPPVPTPPKPRK